MKKLSIVLFIAVTIISCKKNDTEQGTPKCVENKIIDFKKSTNCNVAKVDEYSFQGNTVFAFDPGNCSPDMTTEVITADCETLGYLGGISGNTKINGTNFSNAEFIKTIWKQ